ncbi:MAG: twin-arginine translocase subunit TatB [Actinomycetota bacterium]|jgi:Tat protein translocase TatB subunit
MFNVGGGEILVILVLALLVLGPERLPDAVRKVGRAVGEIRRMTSGFEEEMRSVVDLSSTDALSTTESGPSLPPIENSGPRPPGNPYVVDLSETTASGEPSTESPKEDYS